MATPSSDREAAARVVALVVAARGCVDDRALDVLEALNAFPSLAVERARFVELARAYAGQVGSHLCETSWLRQEDLEVLDRLLVQVTDPAKRQLAARLAAAVLDADGGVSGEERMVFSHLMASWHLSMAREGRSVRGNGAGAGRA